MTTIYLKGEKINTCGDIPDVGETTKEFILVNEDLREVKLSDYDGKIKILNIFPSLDTATCSTSVKKFTHEAVKISTDVVILQISADLPFAHKRFCEAEDLSTRTLSTFRSTFAKDYGLEIMDGPLKGLCSRVVLVLDGNNKVHYAEQVEEISDEPNYDNAFATLDAENFGN